MSGSGVWPARQLDGSAQAPLNKTQCAAKLCIETHNLVQPLEPVTPAASSANSARPDPAGLRERPDSYHGVRPVRPTPPPPPQSVARAGQRPPDQRLAQMRPPARRPTTARF